MIWPAQNSPAHRLGLQGQRQLLRRQVVVLHRVAGPDQSGVLEPGRGLDDLLLDEHRQARGQPLQVHLLGRDALGLDEHGVLLPLGEVDELAVDRRAVPRALSADRAALERAEMEVLGHDFVRGGRRVRQVAGHLAPWSRRLPVREGKGSGVSLLRDHPVGVDGRPVDPRRRRRLESIELEPGVQQALRTGAERAVRPLARQRKLRSPMTILPRRKVPVARTTERQREAPPVGQLRPP